MSVKPNLNEAPEAQTRRSLINRLRDLEDRESWQDFFDTYWKLIYTFAMRAGLTEEEAEDVVQETIVAVSRYIQDYQYDPKVCSFKSWLMHKTRWRIIDQVRKRQPGFVERIGTAIGTGQGAEIDRVPDPQTLETDAFWENEWQRNILEAAMERIKGRLNPEHYQIFYLSTIRKLGPAKVAKAMGATIAKVYLVKHRVAALIKREVQLLETKSF